MVSIFLKNILAHQCCSSELLVIPMAPWFQKNNPPLAAGCGSGVGSAAGSGLSGVTAGVACAAAAGLKEESDACRGWRPLAGEMLVVWL